MRSGSAGSQPAGDNQNRLALSAGRIRFGRAGSRLAGYDLYGLVLSADWIRFGLLALGWLDVI